MKDNGNQLKRGIVLSYVNMGLSNLIPIFYTPIMISLLGQSEYGLYKLASSVTSYLSLISLGIGSAITRYLIKAQEEDGSEAEKRVLGLFMVIFQIIAVAAFIVGLLITWNLDIWYGASLSSEELSRMQILVFLMACNTALSFSGAPYLSAITAHERFVFVQCSNIILTCIGPLLNLVMLFCGFASIGMAISSLMITLGVRVAYTLYLHVVMGLHAQYKSMPFHLLKEILMFSFWVFLSSVVAQLYNVTDSVMIGMIPELATTGVAVYSIGTVFSSIVNSATTTISSLLTPRVNRMVFSGHSGTELTAMTISAGRVQCYIMALLVSGFITFGQPFLHFYVGPEYNEAYWIAVFIMIPNMIPLVQSVCLSCIVAQNKHQFRAVVYLIGAIINVIGTWYLLHSIGVVGAALMTGISLLLGQGLAMNWFYWKKTEINIFLFWKRIGPILLCTSILCFTAVLTGKNLFNFYKLENMILGIIVYTVVYALLHWKFTLIPEEKALCFAVQKRFLLKVNREEKR